MTKGMILDLKMRDKAGTNVTDYSRYGNDGAVSGGAVWTEQGMRFDGVDGVVRIPDSESLSPTSAMTAMVWVKGAAQDSKGIISHWDNDINEKGMLLYSSDGTSDKLRLLISDNGVFDVGHRKNYYSSIVVFDNTWHLVGFSFDAGTLKLYIDGVKDTNPTKLQDDAITTIHNSTADVTIGCFLTSDTPTGFFNGTIDQPIIYNRALHLREIKAMYNEMRHNYD